jgi:PKD repeat protein
MSGSRFTANEDLTGTAIETELVLYEENQDAADEHHGGALSFDNNGKLLFTTGEQFDPLSSPLLTSPRGKVHRINADGTIPTDNPFYDGAGPNVDSIWARGLRNPFRAYYDAPTERYANGAVASTFNFEPANGAADGPYGDIVYLAEGPDGALYYVDLGYSDDSGSWGISKIRRIRYVQDNQAPVVVVAATPTSGPTPLDVAFSSAGSFDPEGQPLTYSWAFGDGSTSTEANPAHTYTTAGAYQARLTVSDGVNTSISTPLTISAGGVPSATILTPSDGATFQAGDVIAYGGDGTDPDDGTLPDSAFTWNIDFLHEGHVHPGTPITGVRSGSFTIPTSGHDFTGNTRYRISLTVRDSTGLTSTRSVIINPRKVDLTFDTVPSGRTIYLDGIARTTPLIYDTLVGFNHTIEARDQGPYTFESWSDGGAQQHTITVPTAVQSYIAVFAVTEPPTGVAGAWNFNEGAGATVNDSSGNGNNGTLSGGGATWTTAGKYGGALSFDGSSGNVTVANAGTLNFGSSYTLEAWVRPTTLSGYQTILIKETSGGGVCGYWLQTLYIGVASGFHNNGCREHTSGSPAIPLNEWSHLAAVFDDASDTYTLYLNGDVIATDSESSLPEPNTQDLLFGQSTCSSCGYEHWHGFIDDIRVYNRALTRASAAVDPHPRDEGSGVTRPAPAVPQQLPAVVAGFAGRVAELAALTSLLDESADAGGTVVISAVDGMGGIGKPKPGL